MTVGVVWTVRTGTVTNSIGHAYSLNTVPIVDEETFSSTRYWNKADLTSWDGVSATTFQGETADGSVTRAETILAGGTPSNPL